MLRIESWLPFEIELEATIRDRVRIWVTIRVRA